MRVRDKRAACWILNCTMPFSLSKRARGRAWASAGFRPLTAPLRHADRERASRPEQIKDDIMSTFFYLRDDGEYAEATSDEILACAQNIISERFAGDSTPLINPVLVRAYLRLHIGALDYEVFGMLHLDKGHRLIAAENIFRGTVDHSVVHVRELVRSVCTRRTAAVILYHNHPSGRAEPSPEDERLTYRIKHVFDAIEVRVLDHIIIGKGYYSFSEAGLL
jgi:DNA repair protein RadC